MSFQHEAVPAWMNPGGPDPALLRAMTTRRFAYCLAADEAASDFLFTAPDTLEHTYKIAYWLNNQSSPGNAPVNRLFTLEEG